jgi:hypothetical protein
MLLQLSRTRCSKPASRCAIAMKSVAARFSRRIITSVFGSLKRVDNRRALANATARAHQCSAVCSRISAARGTRRGTVCGIRKQLLRGHDRDARDASARRAQVVDNSILSKCARTLPTGAAVCGDRGHRETRRALATHACDRTSRAACIAQTCPSAQRHQGSQRALRSVSTARERIAWRARARQLLRASYAARVMQNAAPQMPVMSARIARLRGRGVAAQTLRVENCTCKENGNWYDCENAGALSSSASLKFFEKERASGHRWKPVTTCCGTWVCR